MLSISARKLKKAAKENLKISRQAVEAQEKTIKKRYGPFSDEVALGIVAHKAGVDISKIVSEKEILVSIQNALDRIALLKSDTPPNKTRTIVRTITVNIGKDLSLSDPLLNKQILQDAQSMTVVYADIYVFENSVRDVINRVLTKNIDFDWWSSKAVKKEILDKIQDRIDNENRNPWHGRRGAHPIYYSDISDLEYLMRRHWGYFRDIFPRFAWVSEILEKVMISRNVIDHHNPLSKRDQKRLKMNIEDWQKQIDANKFKL